MIEILICALAVVYLTRLAFLCVGWALARGAWLALAAARLCVPRRPRHARPEASVAVGGNVVQLRPRR